MTNAPDTERSGAVRNHLVRALEADLIGPFQPPTDGEDAEEVLHLPPSRWYLAGFLAPEAGRLPSEPTDDDYGAGNDRAELDGTDQEPAPKRSNLLPASIGLSVLLPPSEAPSLVERQADVVTATVSYAEYRAETEEDADGRRRTLWHREARVPITVDVPLDAPEIALELPGTHGVWLRGKLEPAVAGADPGTRLEPGTRALALFVVNQRKPGAKGRQDEPFLFQVRLELFYANGFVKRPNRTGESGNNYDDRIADLQYRNHFEYAVGHGVSAEVVRRDGDPEGKVDRVATQWIPRVEVPRVKTRDVPGVEVAMRALSEIEDPAGMKEALSSLPEAYEAWIAEQATIDPGSDERRELQVRLVQEARLCNRRITEGIELLAANPMALDAFRLTNQAMALVRRNKDENPRWRLFQLAFILMNLPSVTDPSHEKRDTVELIFFPTGGGKTEAYLGVIAYMLVMRRLKGRERPDGGLGVAVLLRYTLRLLTLDQLARAAGLICALERIRVERPDLGAVRFSIGLWVGRSATENTLSRVADRVGEYKRGQTKLSPVPLTECPWCGTTLKKDLFFLVPTPQNPERLVVGCPSPRCEFSRGRNRDGLPIAFVDEQVYRELPSFLVATVDKFAMMPWRGETGMLFGRAMARRGDKFYGPMDKVPADVEALPEGLRPPELIVQDELHLISGPLGTMVGLYETTIDALCRERLCRERLPGEGSVPLGEFKGGGDSPSPGAKVIASTATVRRAQDQTRALFNRDVKLFPPPGVDASETFFAQVDPEQESGHVPGRLYVGVAAPGRAMKALLIRVYVTLLAAAQKVYDQRQSPAQEADGYMTLVGYFNSLRELGGMRRLVEDEVRTRTADAGSRRPENVLDGRHPWFKKRQIGGDPVELTSREPTARISDSKARLEKPYAEKKSRVDVLLASNMISVGVDIDRLGLMVVAGQPKTTSEYIYPGVEPGGSPESLAGSGGHVFQSLQAAGSFAL